MLVAITGLPDGVVGRRAEGVFSLDDFRTDVQPLVHQVRHGSEERLRLLLHLGPEFQGFGPGAWGELTKDLMHLPFHRGAVVTDDDRVRNGLNVLRFLLRGSIKTFRNRDYEQAVTWVAS